MSFRRRTILCLFALLVGASGIVTLIVGARSAQADPPYPLTQTYYPVSDAKTNETNSSTKYGHQTTVQVDANPVVKSYLKFSLYGIPTGSTIRTA